MFLGNVTVAQLIKKFAFSYRPKLFINPNTKFCHKSETNSVHTLSSTCVDSFSFKIRTVSSSSQWSSLSMFSDQKGLRRLPCYMPHLIPVASCLVWLHYTWRKLQCLKFLITKTRTFSYYSIPLRSKCCQRRLWKYSFFNLKNTVSLLHKSRVLIIIILVLFYILYVNTKTSGLNCGQQLSEFILVLTI